MIVKEFTTMYQRPSYPLPLPDSKEYRFITEAAKNSHTYIFPEYFTFSREKNAEESYLDSLNTLNDLVKLSSSDPFKDTLLIGGTVITRKDNSYFNSSPVILNGEILYYYSKRSLFRLENRYLKPGTKDLCFTHPVTGKKTGILICADILNPESYKNYTGADEIIIPVASPFRPEDSEEDQNLRDLNIFLHAARTTGANIFKCCLSPDKSQEKIHVQGRSLVVTPQKVLFRAPDITWRGHILYSSLKNEVISEEYNHEI